MSTLQQRFNQLNLKVASLKGQRDTLEKTYREKQEVLSTLQSNLKTQKECTALFQALSAKLQEQTTRKVADIVTKAYQFIFQNDDQFIIDTEIKRDIPSAQFYIKKADGRTFDPLEEEGGGVVDVISFSLRVAALLLCSPKLNSVLVLDEPFKHLSNSTFPYRERAADFLTKLSEEYGVQILLTTHAKEFEAAADKVYELGTDDKGVSKVAIVR
jgi:DNA repair exonuclease SbcCD ATPase subunit